MVLVCNGLSSGLYMDCVKELHGDKYKFFVSYWYNQGKWTLSFRGNEYPIINVAKSLGGGGHTYACGATVEHLPKFLNVNI